MKVARDARAAKVWFPPTFRPGHIMRVQNQCRVWAACGLWATGITVDFAADLLPQRRKAAWSPICRLSAARRMSAVLDMAGSLTLSRSAAIAHDCAFEEAVWPLSKDASSSDAFA